MARSVLTQQNVMEAGIAASLSADPALLPEPSVYFQDFNFGGTHFESLWGNAEALSGVSEGISDVAVESAAKHTMERQRENNGVAVDIAIDAANEVTRQNLECMQARSAQLGRDIAEMEDGFEAQYGDAWREIFANQILDPDQARRRDGETMQQYRARLEMLFDAEMLDSNGNIKPEYADHLIARWVQARREKADLDDDIERRMDPNTSAAEGAEIDRGIFQNGTFNQVRQSQTEITIQGQESEILAAGTDDQRDDIDERLGSTEAQANGFLTMRPT